MPHKPLILITNDDGYEARGLAALVEAAKDFGEVIVITPDGPRSGMGHAITMNLPLRVKHYKTKNGIEFYRTNGTSVDCVKLGQRVLLQDRKIDLVLSGINHGSNSSVSIIYSGTMAAAIEACFEGLPAIGFSLLDYSSKADFSTAIVFAKQIIDRVMKERLPKHVCLNVNIPKLQLAEIKGIKITRQTLGYWHEDLEEHTDPFGGKYYWLAGFLVNLEKEAIDTCEWALQNGYVSVTPVHFDMTSHHTIVQLKHWEHD
ncbi:MAG: 5'/3'-nucleotidase SurE [Bacteroidales bacterium]|jgi:5'-nucleotidase|nr:5'/3'-nucleotidase SurE [Bacteroidales bacterium]